MPTVFVTAPRETAEEIARSIVEERLAACVNRVPCSSSTYRWEGEVLEDDETILLAKTTTDRYDDLVERVKAEHPYDVPCIERFEEDDTFDSSATWRTRVTAPGEDQSLNDGG